MLHNKGHADKQTACTAASLKPLTAIEQLFMQSWTPILIIVLLGLSWFIWTVYGRLLLNKVVWVKRINPPEIHSLGDIKINGDLLAVKFLWGIKTFSLKQIKQIKAFAQNDWGLEEHEQIDILFDTAEKITFSASLQEHREFVQTITKKVGITDKTWIWGDLPQLGDKLGRDLVYEKTKSR